MNPLLLAETVFFKDSACLYWNVVRSMHVKLKKNETKEK